LTVAGIIRNVSPVKTAVKILPLIVLAIALAIFTGCKTASEGKVGTVELFNGTNLDGWTFFMKTNADPMETWSVTNGVIHCTGTPTGYARTVEIYSNYTLTVVWRFVKVAPHEDNSGILIHIQPPDVIFPKNVQCQGKYQHQGDLILERGASADGYPSTPKDVTIPQNGLPNEKAVGEWNTDTIICYDGIITLNVNGEFMNQITGCSLTSGFIGIQSEGGEIEVRKLSLGPIPMQ
jgi:Domain of Unknown Function (DUF1080)